MNLNLNDIHNILAAGGTVTEEFQRLEERWNLYRNIETNVADRLTSAVLGTAHEDDIATLHALAVASEGASTVETATVRNTVLRTIDAAMRREYSKTATANYNAIRAKFNAEADAFTKAHQITAATTDPARLVTADAKTRQAWAAGQASALALTNHVALLVTAAQLAGVTINHPTKPIGLVADVTGLHRRRVWEAWDEGWTALLELGASINATTLDDYEDYREPKPIEVRHVRQGIGWYNVDVDPEDQDVPLDNTPSFANQL